MSLAFLLRASSKVNAAMAKKRFKHKAAKNTSRHDVTSVETEVAKFLRAAKAIQKTSRLLRRDLRECARLYRVVRAAFGPHLFLPHQPPNSAMNLQRFKTYFQMTKGLMELKFKLLKELMRVHGFHPDRPHEMWTLTEIFAAAALLPAGIQYQQRPADTRMWGQLVQTPSKEVARLAEHLCKHAHSQKRFTLENYNSKLSNK